MTPSEQRAPYIRQYDPGRDFPAVIEVFRETCDESLKVEPIWTIASYIWCRPYLLLTPGYCFVIDDGHGEAVGYIIGAPDSGNFCEQWCERYVPHILSELDDLPQYRSVSQERALDIARRRNELLEDIRSNPRKFILGDHGNALQHFGHLHIDIVVSHQRRGFGRKLISAFCSAVRNEGCPGLYLGMGATNHGAGQFYESCGFRRLPKVLDDGATGELGRTKKTDEGEGTTYFVIDL